MSCERLSTYGQLRLVERCFRLPALQASNRVHSFDVDIWLSLCYGALVGWSICGSLASSLAVEGARAYGIVRLPVRGPSG